MRAPYACHSGEHVTANRRRFLGSMGNMLAGGGAMAAGLGSFTRGAVATDLKARDMRIVVLNLYGGLSQLESWDPKPGTASGGPTRAIPTSVPGIHISELLPHTAQQMHHLCLLRGVNSSENDHAKGIYQILTGRRKTPAADYPQIGAVAARTLCEESAGLPGHVLVIPGGGGGRGKEAAYLGPKYASIALGGDKPPKNTVKPDIISDAAELRRHEFRRRVNQHFLARQGSAITDAYTFSYEQALQLMERRDVFDVSKEPARDVQRYGDHDFGRQCLLARRLLENGVSFVQVKHSNYDTHNDNFNFHLEQLGEFDQAFACLVEDLAQRGLLEQTLVVVLSEFGRTPKINANYGRDHWSKAWTVVMGGARVVAGAAFGATNADGTEVIDGQVDHGELFHTYLTAVGVDSSQNIVVDGREVPLADPAVGPVWKVIS
ncbi:MAG: DUF1501 domain-containing protein [Planctomycetales bacterium]|nr:DUF1501 domain-containing protein [Planctomycetales bacterium]